MLWATDRDSGANDALFKIDIATGTYVPDAFGPGVDYVVITGAGTSERDIDDIAIDPTTSTLYGIANAGGTADRLVSIDKTTGVAAPVNPGSPQIGITDVEGLSFFNDGSLYGSTGGGGNNANHLIRINTTDGKVDTTYGPDPGYAFGTGGDYEALGCLNDNIAPNTIDGTVYRDLDEDGALDGGEAGEPGVSVRLYRDLNGDGAVDGGDVLVDTQVTAADGTFSWDTGVLGDYVMEIETGTLPADSTLTTDNVEVATFTGANQGDAGNDFGYTLPPILSTTKTSDATGPVSPGQVITYTINVTNTSTDVTQTNVTIDDAVPAGTTYVPGSSSITRPAAINDTLADDFSADNSWNQNDGSINFPVEWIEIGNNTDPTNGSVRIDSDGDPAVTELYAVRINGDGDGLERSFDASAYTSGTVSWETRRNGLSGTFVVDITNNRSAGTPTWTQLASYTDGDENEYQADSAAIPVPLTNDMALRFLFETRNGGRMHVDDVVIALSSSTPRPFRAVTRRPGNRSRTTRRSPPVRP